MNLPMNMYIIYLHFTAKVIEYKISYDFEYMTAYLAYIIWALIYVNQFQQKQFKFIAGIWPSSTAFPYSFIKVNCFQEGYSNFNK